MIAAEVKYGSPNWWTQRPKREKTHCFDMLCLDMLHNRLALTERFSTHCARFDTLDKRLNWQQQLELVKWLTASLNCKLSHGGLIFKYLKLQRIYFEFLIYLEVLAKKHCHINFLIFPVLGHGLVLKGEWLTKCTFQNWG